MSSGRWRWFLLLALAALALMVSTAALFNLAADGDDGADGSAGTAAAKSDPREARFYRQMPRDIVQCQLCPNRCVLTPNKIGVCRNYQNRGGKLYSLVYGKPCSVSEEYIEKAPFYHFLPGSKRLCLATTGCNMRCKFCQNWQIAQCDAGRLPTHDLSPREVVRKAKERGIPIICFTFSEPTNFYEYMYDICVEAKKEGVRTVMVSNGYINPEPLKKLLKVLDAMKVDFKAYSEDFYKKITSGKLQPVLETMRTVKDSGVHLEVVNLVIPTLNDDPEQVRKLCEFVAKELGPEVPVHFSRFSPMYKLKHLPPTPPRTLEDCAKIAKEAGLKHVYIGNLPGHELNCSYCPKCGEKIINRVGYHVRGEDVKLENGACPKCGAVVYGVWE